MNQLRPFFLLIGRASVFWIGSATLIALSFLMIGLSQPEDLITPYVDAVFLAAVAFPAAAGWLAGAVIREFQSSSFAWALPTVNRRIATGYLLAGGAVVLLVAGLAFLSPSNSQPLVTLIAVGSAGYCLAGDFFAPLFRWMTMLDLVLAVVLFTRSRQLSELAAVHPVLTFLVALILALFGLVRLFSRTALRQRPFRLSKPFPGSYFLERSRRSERQRWALQRPQRTGWRLGYLGVRTWGWVRAATYELYGPLGWRTVPRVLSRLWILALLFVIYAWSDKGRLTFSESLGKTTYQLLFASPHVPEFGESADRSGLVILVIGAAGAIAALWSFSALSTNLAYPLSRIELARVIHRAGLVDSGVFFFGVLAALTTVGQAAGWLVGYPLRFDFVPFFLHPLGGTLILMPLAQWGRVQVQAAARRHEQDLVVVLIFTVIAFVALVWIWTAFSIRLAVHPLLELTGTAILFLATQGFFRRRLAGFYTTADLA